MPLTCEHLVEGHLDALHAYARMRLRDGDLARDLVQRTFLKAFQKLGQLRAPEAARVWLLAILRNEIAMEYRAHARFEAWDAEDFEELADPGTPEGVDPGLLEALPEALARLSDGARSLLLLRFQQDLSYEQIAELLNLPLGTVQSRLHRAKASLRAQMELTRADSDGGAA